MHFFIADLSVKILLIKQKHPTVYTKVLRWDLGLAFKAGNQRIIFK